MSLARANWLADGAQIEATAAENENLTENTVT